MALQSLRSFNEGAQSSAVSHRTSVSGARRSVRGRYRRLHAVAFAALLAVVSIPMAASATGAVQQSGDRSRNVAGAVNTAFAETQTAFPSQNYAAREANAKGLEKFEGGDTIVIGGSALLLILLVVLIVILI